MSKSWYRVEMRTEGREVYLVEASSAEEAKDSWMDGELIVSEVLSSDFYSVEEEEE